MRKGEKPAKATARDLIESSGLFDPHWYLAQYSDAFQSGTDPLEHYLSVGAGCGYSPGPQFDAAWYLAHNPDVATAAMNPFLHFLQCGAKEGRKPNEAALGTERRTHWRDTRPSESNISKWDGWYENVNSEIMSAFRYADTITYRMAAAFMVDVKEVEDWGCGTGGFKRFYRGKYTGIDGSRTPFADKIVDLCNYESNVDGIVIRHVLEHNYQWEKILEAAVRSFTKKLCVILFTPFSDTTKEIAHNRQHGVDVPDLSFCREDIESKFSALCWELFDNISTPSGYGTEHIYFVWKQTDLKKVTAFLEEPHQRKRRDLSKKPKRAVYTAIFGDYDSLKDIPPQEGIDLICFTDNETLTHHTWQVRYTEPKYAYPRLSAKYYKMLPHVVLAEYDETVWIDASFQVQHTGFAADVFEYLQDAAIAVFLHPDRGCIYDEAEVSKAMEKYRDQDISGQVNHYRQQGFPDKGGLFAGGIIARCNNDAAIRRFNQMWMAENEKWTHQDQLSLAYLLWRLDIKPAVFRQHQWNCQWGVWDWGPHGHWL